MNCCVVLKVRRATQVLQVPRPKLPNNRRLKGGFGEQRAEYLAGSKLRGRVIVHSTNPFGAALIEKTLRDGGISNVEVAPFDVLGVLRER